MKYSKEDTMSYKWNILTTILVLVLVVPFSQAAPYKVDGSSSEAFKSSINYISKDLSDEQKVQLALALLKLKLAGVNSASQLQQRPELMANEPTQELLDTVNGLTYREIIALAEQTSTLQISIGRGADSKRPAIPLPPKQPRMREFPKDPKTLPIKPEPEVDGHELSAIYVEEPRWPSSALWAGQEGWVLLEFKLDDKGQPVNVTMLDSSPEKVFDSSAIASLPKWVFELPPGHKTESIYQYVLEYRLAEDDDFDFQGDVTSLSISTVDIKQVKLESLTDEQLVLSINYSLEPFHQGDRIYEAIIMFKHSEGYFEPVPTLPVGENLLTEPSGTTLITTPLPDQSELELLKGELQYVIMVMQRSDDKGTYSSIGSSRIFRKQLDGFE
jgi:TonB family protein